MKNILWTNILFLRLGDESEVIWTDARYVVALLLEGYSYSQKVVKPIKMEKLTTTNDLFWKFSVILAKYDQTRRSHAEWHRLVSLILTDIWKESNHLYHARYSYVLSTSNKYCFKILYSTNKKEQIARKWWPRIVFHVKSTCYVYAIFLSFVFGGYPIIGIPILTGTLIIHDF